MFAQVFLFAKTRQVTEGLDIESANTSCNLIQVSARGPRSYGESRKTKNADRAKKKESLRKRHLGIVLCILHPQKATNFGKV